MSDTCEFMRGPQPAKMLVLGMIAMSRVNDTVGVCSGGIGADVCSVFTWNGSFCNQLQRYDRYRR